MADNTYLSINTNTSTNIEDNTDKILVFDEAQVYGISYKNLVKEIAKEIINDNASNIKSTGTNAEIFNDYTNNEAKGAYSHAEGLQTYTEHEASHVEGKGTKSTTPSCIGQHIQGRYNKISTDLAYLHIVGNGTDSSHSNAHTLRDNGDAWFAGDVYIYGDSQVDSNAKRIPVVYVGSDTPDNAIGKNGDIYCKLLQ